MPGKYASVSDVVLYSAEGLWIQENGEKKMNPQLIEIASKVVEAMEEEGIRRRDTNGPKYRVWVIEGKSFYPLHSFFQGVFLTCWSCRIIRCL